MKYKVLLISLLKSLSFLYDAFEILLLILSSFFRVTQSVENILVDTLIKVL